MERKIGHYSFIIGVIVALILGLASQALGEAQVWLYLLLVLAGLIVGLINVTGKETKEFLLVATVLVIVSGVGSAAETLKNALFLGPYLQGILTNVMVFVVSATVVVALKDIYALSQNQ